MKIDNDNLLRLRFFKVGEFVKIVGAEKSDDGKVLIMTPRSRIIPTKKFRTSQIREASVFGDVGTESCDLKWGSGRVDCGHRCRR